MKKPKTWAGASLVTLFALVPILGSATAAEADTMCVRVRIPPASVSQTVCFPVP